jgi:basic amino acid/polyamine antiporter, APA family
VSEPETNPSDDPAWRPSLSFWDATSLMVGIVVGSSIFAAPKTIFSSVPSSAAGLAAWGVAGILSLLGGLVFAELAVSLPRGGAYTYLTKAFGSLAGLVYGIAFSSIIVTTTIGAMAFTFARYASQVFPRLAPDMVWAAGAVVALSILNSWSIQHGRWTQNVLSASKVLGLGGIVIAGLLAAGTGASAVPVVAAESTNVRIDYGLAMVLALYAYGGWSDAATVAAEVRNRGRSIPLSLVGGLAAVTLIYLLVNTAYLSSLGLDGVRATETPAREVVLRAAGPTAADAVSILVMISALGAIHGMLFSGSRSIAALGRDHRLFAGLGRWNAERGVPVVGVWGLAVISLFQIAAIAIAPVENKLDGFETLVFVSAPTYWALMLACGAAFFQLRRKGESPRGFACPGFPVVPLIFCGTCGFMMWRALAYAGFKGLLWPTLAPPIASLVIALLTRREKASGPP